MANTLGENLKQIRKEKKMTLLVLSENSGVKLSTLSAIEQGRILSPSLESLEKIAQTLEIPRDTLLGSGEEFPTFYKSDLKGVVECVYKKEGLTLVSFTPLLKEIFIGKAVLKPKKSIDFNKFQNLTFVFLEIIFGKLEAKWESQNSLVTEGENLSLRPPQGKILSNPLGTKETSFLIVTRPSIISASHASQKL